MGNEISQVQDYQTENEADLSTSKKNEQNADDDNNNSNNNTKNTLDLVQEVDVNDGFQEIGGSYTDFDDDEEDDDDFFDFVSADNKVKDIFELFDKVQDLGSGASCNVILVKRITPKNTNSDSNSNSNSDSNTEESKISTYKQRPRRIIIYKLYCH
jgi:hypothetical protein